MQSVPLQPIPSQSAKVVLGNQNCELVIYQKAQGLFVNVNCNGIDVSTSTIARDTVPLVSQEYLGFSGNLLFIDTQGNSDPNYAGLGGRFDLVYLTADEYALIR